MDKMAEQARKVMRTEYYVPGEPTKRSAPTDDTASETSGDRLRDHTRLVQEP